MDRIPRLADAACKVSARFFSPPAGLERYFTSFYLAEIEVADGRTVVDHLHPEWANLRFASGSGLCASNVRGARLHNAPHAITGPSGRAIRFEVGSCRIWGMGLLPLGWAKFVPAPAAYFADAVIAPHDHPVFAPFAQLGATLFGPLPCAEAELARIGAFFLTLAASAPADDRRIEAIHAALVDPEVSGVAQMGAHCGLPARTVERQCLRAFGFTPKLLLRRQRFVRSLSQYMLDPSLKWIGALDGHYHDQAQFVREFRQFMGMTPSDYAQMPHPILGAFVRARAAAARAPMQALDRPGGAAIGLGD